MGCFSYTCSISGLPITEGTDIVYLALAPGEGTRGITVSDAWIPATLPIRGCYNDYGSIDKLVPGAAVDAFFRALASRALEREVGENRVHDIAVHASLTREEWLQALWEERVQVKRRDGQVATLIQTMIRADVWDYLVSNSIETVERSVNSSSLLRGMANVLEFSPLELEVTGACVELFCVTRGLSRLGRPWARGTCCGPQFPYWRFQQGFYALLGKAIDERLARHERDYGEPYQDE